NFKDIRRIAVRAGKGGNGCVSFLREKYVENGPPNGGHGGRGGNVIFRVDPQETSLNFVESTCRAQPGGNGGGKSKHGSNGDDLIVRVPPGTVIREIDPPHLPREVPEAKPEEVSGRFVYFPGWEDQGETKNATIPKEYLVPHPDRPANRLQLDLVQPGTETVVAQGGLGGLGNAFFASGDVRTPRFALRGLLGEARWLELELKTIADAGLVGLPNAGKSTFLSAVSNAHPKVAPYPFTTLNPYLGTVDYDDLQQITLADIPGLIAGAHQNIGLGHHFLRHIVRSHVLVYVLDIGKPRPWDDLATLQRELELYSTTLLEKSALIIANKADLSEMAKTNLVELQSRTKIPIVPVSAKYRKNILKATFMMRKLIEESRENSPTPTEVI
ncbi:P-loop containing nucleoside triphosphate hydrolase protein, partial [Dimargaris cristalligena]